MATCPINSNQVAGPRVNGNGSKTTQDLMNELYGLIDISKITGNSYLVHGGSTNDFICHLVRKNSTLVAFAGIWGSGSTLYFDLFQMTYNKASCVCISFTSSGSSITTNDNSYGKPGANDYFQIFY